MDDGIWIPGIVTRSKKFICHKEDKNSKNEKKEAATQFGLVSGSQEVRLEVRLRKRFSSFLPSFRKGNKFIPSCCCGFPNRFYAPTANNNVIQAHPLCMT